MLWGPALYAIMVYNPLFFYYLKYVYASNSMHAASNIVFCVCNLPEAVRKRNIEAFLGFEFHMLIVQTNKFSDLVNSKKKLEWVVAVANVSSL